MRHLTILILKNKPSYDNLLQQTSKAILSFIFLNLCKESTNKYSARTRPNWHVWLGDSCAVKNQVTIPIKLLTSSLFSLGMDST